MAPELLEYNDECDDGKSLLLTTDSDVYAFSMTALEVSYITPSIDLICPGKIDVPFCTRS